MRSGALVDVLALVPANMQVCMEQLDAAAHGGLKRFGSIEEIVHDPTESNYAVVLIPATGFSAEGWWTLWGFLNGMEPRPSILVYALKSDFEMWSSVLDAGCFDLIVPPFTTEKLRRTILLALEDYARRSKEGLN